jgi:DNA-directed RNA polymerase specialized sigma24 family protein
MLERERLKSLYAVIRKNLSDFEYAVWQLYMSGRSANEIAARLDTDAKSVSNAVYRIRKKLRACLG